MTAGLKIKGGYGQPCSDVSESIGDTVSAGLSRE
jgi:hypothetical protein